MNKKPVTLDAQWADADMAESVGEQITKRGRHHVADFVERKKEENAERNARYLRDYGGRDLDPRRVPRPDQVESGRTWKTESKIRFPSAAYRAGYGLIDWRA